MRITMDVHYNGAFMLNPLRYENGTVLTLTIPSELSFLEFIMLLEKKIGNPLSGVYYPLPGFDLARKSLRIENDYDLTVLYGLGDGVYGRLSIYLDHLNDGENISRYLLEKPRQEDANHSEDDVNYEPNNVDDEDDNDSIASLNHLSEGEDEVAELRHRKAKAKELTKQPHEVVISKNKRKVNEVEYEPKTIVEEHEHFLKKIVIYLRGEENDIEESTNGDNFIVHDDNFVNHDDSTHWKSKKPMIGERYENFSQLKECVAYYALANGFSIWYERSSRKSIIARCGTRPPKTTKKTEEAKEKTEDVIVKTEEVLPDCPWRLYACMMSNEKSFQVKSLKDLHTCSRNFKFGSLINYKWIGKQFADKIRINPEIKLVHLAEMVMKKYKCFVTPNVCSRARSWALNEYEKTLVEHYGMLRSYADVLLKTNPGSTVKLGLVTNPNEVKYFDRFYVCLNGLKEGWKHGCRRIIALDGCFLKTVCQGQLLTATGRDGNNHIFPVAWAVVTVENKDNWAWFLSLLVDDLDMPLGNGLTLMSDQHKGLMEAVRQVMPHAEHRQCARHIYQNFKKVYNGLEFSNFFWSACKATYPQEFDRIMENIKRANPNAYKYLQSRNPKSWSRAFFEVGRGCDAVENGFSECFNSVLVTVRNKPIITMLEAIRVIVMERMNTMRETSRRWHDVICPTIRKKLEWLKDQKRNWFVHFAGGDMFEVRYGEDAWCVDEKSRTCTCRLWQLSGLPCPHAIAVIFKLNKRPEDYVAGWFKKVNYHNAYKHYLKPVTGMSTWDLNELDKPLPPIPKRMPGRPKKKRQRSASEGGTVKGRDGVIRVTRIGTIMTCQNCGEAGHNKRGCKVDKKELPPKVKKKSGRPRNKDVRPSGGL